MRAYDGRSCTANAGFAALIALEVGGREEAGVGGGAAVPFVVLSAEGLVGIEIGRVQASVSVSSSLSSSSEELSSQESATGGCVGFLRAGLVVEGLEVEFEVDLEVVVFRERDWSLLETAVVGDVWSAAGIPRV